MPIDPSIALGVRPVQVQDPLESYSRILGIRGERQRLEINDQALAHNKQNMELEKTKADQAAQSQARDMAEEQQIHSIAAQYGGDLTKALPALRTSPIRLKTLMGIEKDINENRKLVAEIGDKELAAQKYKDERIAGLISEAEGMKPEQYLAEYPNIRANYQAITGEDLPPDPIPQAQLPLHKTRVMTRNGLLDERIKTSGAAKAEYDALKSKADADVAAKTVESRIANSAGEAAQNTVDPITKLTPNQQATLDQTQKNQAAQRAIDLQRLGIDQGRLNLAIQEHKEKTNGSLGSLSDSQKSLAQKVADGDLTITQLSRLPDKEAIIAGAIELNPDWSSNTAATKKAFTDPASKQSQNLGTIARIVGHIGRFEKNSNELGTSPSLLTGIKLTGGAAKTSEDAHAIASELEKLVSGGVGTVSQVKAWQDALLSSRQGIRQAAIDEISQLIGSQFEGINQTYKSGLGKDLPLDKFATPEAKQWLAKQGISVGSSTYTPTGKVTMVAPNGQKKEVDESEVKHYESLGAKRK